MHTETMNDAWDTIAPDLLNAYLVWKYKQGIYISFCTVKSHHYLLDTITPQELSHYSYFEVTDINIKSKGFHVYFYQYLLNLSFR
jgi:hypothetical protein